MSKQYFEFAAHPATACSYGIQLERRFSHEIHEDKLHIPCYLNPALADIVSMLLSRGG